MGHKTPIFILRAPTSDEDEMCDGVYYGVVRAFNEARVVSAVFHYQACENC